MKIGTHSIYLHIMRYTTKVTSFVITHSFKHTRGCITLQYLSIDITKVLQCPLPRKQITYTFFRN